jgi:hypothetical protein
MWLCSPMMPATPARARFQAARRFARFSKRPAQLWLAVPSLLIAKLCKPWGSASPIAMRADVVSRPLICAPRCMPSQRLSPLCSTCWASGSACLSRHCWGREGSGRVCRCSATSSSLATGGRQTYPTPANQRQPTSGCACAMKRRSPPPRCYAWLRPHKPATAFTTSS